MAVLGQEDSGSVADCLEPVWYAAYIWTRHEKKVEERLRDKGIEAYLPVYRKVHRWKNRVRAEVELPLFPSYLFTRISPREQVRVLEVPGVLSLVGNGRKPTAIPTADVEKLRTGLRAVHAEPHPFLKIGDRVRVVSGPFEGMNGVMLRGKQDRVILSIDQIKSSMAVELDTSDLEIVTKEAIGRTCMRSAAPW